MFRVSLLSFFLVAVGAADLRAATADLERQFRQLQLNFGDIDLNEIQFNFAGVNFNAQVAQEECPTQWGSVFQCLLKDCPNALNVCPDLLANVPEENMGSITEMPMSNMTGMPMETTAPTDGEGTPEQLPEVPDTEMVMTPAPTEGEPMMMPDNETMPVATVVPTGASESLRFLQNDEVPECPELEQAFCDFVEGEDFSECCLTACIPEIQDLVECVILETTGEDRSDCKVPDCLLTTPAPADTTPAPVPTESAADATVVSRVVALAASLLAVAVL